ncbi:uncharacterized protein LOC121529214 isoform X2 [Cheilinus undulatus]|uniref:uncharacterized protein LOC121529214 isoform X2 n=1 Tax=Cheilinus undulatus TaxID=241271 RepID=UPI001BD5697E|nr:uncharacterized protein LOC121529214 isoform X2 [Cheilinus undulatus]
MWVKINLHFLLKSQSSAAACVKVSESVRMSAFCMKILTILCLCCTRLSSSESNAVVWRDVGGSVTIQCRSNTDQDCLTLKKGLNDYEVFYQDRESDNGRTAADFKNRLQSHGKFPNLDILIKNLTTVDMGPYWCEYQKLDPRSLNPVIKKDQGSILLVVRDESKQCDSSSKSLVLVSVGISAAVLVCIIIAVSMWILKGS